MMSTVWLYQSFIPHHLAYLHNSFKVKALFTKLTISQGLDQVFWSDLDLNQPCFYSPCCSSIKVWFKLFFRHVRIYYPLLANESSIVSKLPVNLFTHWPK